LRVFLLKCLLIVSTVVASAFMLINLCDRYYRDKPMDYVAEYKLNALAGKDKNIDINFLFMFSHL